MNYLVLGSAGVVGTDLVQLLRKRSHVVSEFDLKRATDEDLRVRNNPKLLDLIDAADFVYFLAFDVGGSAYLTEYQHSFRFIQNNLQIMSNTFDVLNDFGKQFVFASSQMSNMMHSPYGTLKLLGDQATKSLGGIVIKLWNVYGPEDDPEKTHVITDFISMARQGVIKMRTEGEEARQFLHVRDCSECLYLISQRYADFLKEGHIHITSFEWTKVIEVAQIVSKILPCSIMRGQGGDTTQDRQNQPAAGVLKYWKPTVGLEQGIRWLIDDYSA
jgi:nucleoside-diphosphate-sugar epimerase